MSINTAMAVTWERVSKHPNLFVLVTLALALLGFVSALNARVMTLEIKAAREDQRWEEARMFLLLIPGIDERTAHIEGQVSVLMPRQYRGR